MVSYVSPTSGPTTRPLVFRLGISSGPAVAGVIGKAKFQYDVWGDTVNTASRMESHGVPGRIQLSEATYELVKDDFVVEPRGVVEVKGKGPMETWFLVGAR
jgi:guanylate cyclase